MTRIGAEASAPASSANLGPGFDCLALALDIRCHVNAQPSDRWEVRHTGVHVPPRGSSDAVLTGARAAVGGGGPLRLAVDNRIPIGSGLGSSAAAYASGTVAALRCAGIPVESREVFEKVSELEGHPDNAAAAVYGGLVLVDAEGRVHPLRLSDDYRILVLVPTFRLYTSESRKVVAGTFDIGTVVRSLSRMAALTTGLASGDAEVLRGALGDELHESSRNRLRPRVGELMEEALAAGAAYAAWSGSGPSVLALARKAEADGVAAGIRSTVGDEVQIHRPAVALRGIV